MALLRYQYLQSPHLGVQPAATGVERSRGPAERRHDLVPNHVETEAGRRVARLLHGPRCDCLLIRKGKRLSSDDSSQAVEVVIGHVQQPLNPVGDQGVSTGCVKRVEIARHPVEQVYIEERREAVGLLFTRASAGL